MRKGSVRRVTRLSQTTAKVAFTPCRKNFPEASSSQLSFVRRGNFVYNYFNKMSDTSEHAEIGCSFYHRDADPGLALRSSD